MNNLIYINFIRTTLEKCNLSTNNLPPPRPSQSKFNNSNSSTSASSSSKGWTAQGVDELWQNLQENERIRRRQFAKSDFFHGIAKNRQLAQQRAEAHKRMEEIIRDEIDEIQRRTGVTQVYNSK